MSLRGVQGIGLERRGNPVLNQWLHLASRCPNSTLNYAHTSQITSAPETAAINVKGMPMRRKSRVSTL